MLDLKTTIKEGDEITIRARVERTFPGSDAMSVTPLIAANDGTFYTDRPATYFLINRVEIATHEPKVAA